MLSAVFRTIRERGLMQAGDRVLVGVSGGPDSMALLHVLWELSARLGIALEVVTVDHGLRAEARREAELVRERAEALALPFHLLPVDVAAARRAGGASLQDAARRARLDALALEAVRLGASRVALGHQADDQAETILFRIVRGTGVRGLAGIPWVRGPFVRPLLEVGRAEILRYLRRRSIPYVLDPSNDDLRFARARLRRQVLPVLAAQNPRVSEALRALGAAAAEVAVSRAADELIADARAAGLPLSRRAAATLARASRAGGSRQVDVAGGRAHIEYGRVTFHPRAPVEVPPVPVGAGARGPVRVEGPGEYALDGGPAIQVRTGDGVPAPDGAGGATFDAALLAWPLEVRALRPGDRMRPRGGRGSRKLADLLIDAKIPRAARARLPVVAAGDGTIIFVPGLRPAELARPTGKTFGWVRLSAATRV